MKTCNKTEWQLKQLKHCKCYRLIIKLNYTSLTLWLMVVIMNACCLLGTVYLYLDFYLAALLLPQRWTNRRWDRLDCNSISLISLSLPLTSQLPSWSLSGLMIIFLIVCLSLSPHFWVSFISLNCSLSPHLCSSSFSVGSSPHKPPISHSLMNTSVFSVGRLLLLCLSFADRSSTEVGVATYSGAWMFMNLFRIISVSV